MEKLGFLISLEALCWMKEDAQKVVSVLDHTSPPFQSGGTRQYRLDKDTGDYRLLYMTYVGDKAGA